MLVSSNRIVRNPYTPVRTQGNINPACVATKMETNPQIPRIPMSRSCHTKVLLLISNGPDKYTTDHLQIITAGMMKLCRRYVRSFLLFSFLKFCLSLCLLHLSRYYMFFLRKYIFNQSDHKFFLALSCLFEVFF